MEECEKKDKKSNIKKLNDFSLNNMTFSDLLTLTLHPTCGYSDYKKNDITSQEMCPETPVSPIMQPTFCQDQYGAPKFYSTTASDHPQPPGLSCFLGSQRFPFEIQPNTNLNQLENELVTTCLLSPKSKINTPSYPLSPTLEQPDITLANQALDTLPTGSLSSIELDHAILLETTPMKTLKEERSSVKPKQRSNSDSTPEHWYDLTSSEENGSSEDFYLNPSAEKSVQVLKGLTSIWDPLIIQTDPHEEKCSNSSYATQEEDLSSSKTSECKDSPVNITEQESHSCNILETTSSTVELKATTNLAAAPKNKILKYIALKKIFHKANFASLPTMRQISLDELIEWLQQKQVNTYQLSKKLSYADNNKDTPITVNNALPKFSDTKSLTPNNSLRISTKTNKSAPKQNLDVRYNLIKTTSESKEKENHKASISTTSDYNKPVPSQVPGVKTKTQNAILKSERTESHGIIDKIPSENSKPAFYCAPVVDAKAVNVTLEASKIDSKKEMKTFPCTETETPNAASKSKEMDPQPQCFGGSLLGPWQDLINKSSSGKTMSATTQIRDIGIEKEKTSDNPMFSVQNKLPSPWHDTAENSFTSETISCTSQAPCVQTKKNPPLSFVGSQSSHRTQKSSTSSTDSMYHAPGSSWSGLAYSRSSLGDKHASSFTPNLQQMSSDTNSDRFVQGDDMYATAGPSALSGPVLPFPTINMVNRLPIFPMDFLMQDVGQCCMDSRKLDQILSKIPDKSLSSRSSSIAKKSQQSDSESVSNVAMHRMSAPGTAGGKVNISAGSVQSRRAYWFNFKSKQAKRPDNPSALIRSALHEIQCEKDHNKYIPPEDLDLTPSWEQNHLFEYKTLSSFQKKPK